MKAIINRTNLESVKNTAKAFVYMDPEYRDYGIVSHPFMEYRTQPIIINGERQLVDVSEGDYLDEWRKLTTEKIDKADNVHQVFAMATKPYLPGLFKWVESELSEKDYAETLARLWTRVEFPNNDVNVSTSEFRDYFKKAKKRFLMDKDEYKVFEALPQTITVYRGLQKDATAKALSWTLEKSVAEWFANRFDNNGEVVEGTIDKNYVFAYFDRRSEKEIVLDYTRVRIK